MVTFCWPEIGHDIVVDLQIGHAASTDRIGLKPLKLVKCNSCVGDLEHGKAVSKIPEIIAPDCQVGAFAEHKACNVMLADLCARAHKCYILDNDTVALQDEHPISSGRGRSFCWA